MPMCQIFTDREIQLGSYILHVWHDMLQRVSVVPCVKEYLGTTVPRILRTIQKLHHSIMHTEYTLQYIHLIHNRLVPSVLIALYFICPADHAASFLRIILLTVLYLHEDFALVLFDCYCLSVAKKQ